MKVLIENCEITLGRISSNDPRNDGFFDLVIRDRKVGVTLEVRFSDRALANLLSSRVARGKGLLEVRNGD